MIPHMMKFSRKYFYISVPYKGKFVSLSVNINLPKLTFVKKLIWVPNWFVTSKINQTKIKMQIEKYPEKFYDYHWWQVGMKGLLRNSFISKFEDYGLKCTDFFHNPQMPYHLFCLFEKQ